MSSSENQAPDVVAATTDALVRALRALGKAGRPEEANRIGGKAWWALKETHPREAERINGVMHFLARLEADSPVTSDKENA